MESTNDKVKGTFNRAVGTVKETTGKVLKDREMETNGAIQKEMGKGQHTVGTMKDKLQKTAHKVGDKIEHLAD